MITITDKRDCCGCEACVQCCPKQCIAMRADEEGFSYPETDTSRCVECGLCERVCPILNCGEPRKPLKVYAAKNPNDDIRMKSSSGGIFTMLAEKTLSEGGVVFGARFNDEWEVVHDHTETAEGLAAFRGSKYVQSRIGREYVRAKEYLAAGRKVLFSGTPCQTAGLKRYLGKRYDNLLTVDIVCHGVPSPLVWKRYLGELSDTYNQAITDISFRSKTHGWKSFRFEIYNRDKILTSEPFGGNIFMKGFLGNLYLRPSCYRCRFRSGRSRCDISIGDYWGIQNINPEIDDDKGISLIIINSPEGAQMLASIDCDIAETDYATAKSSNMCLEESVECPPVRHRFFSKLQRSKNIIPIIRKYSENSPNLLKTILKKLIFR